MDFRPALLSKTSVPTHFLLLLLLLAHRSDIYLPLY